MVHTDQKQDYYVFVGTYSLADTQGIHVLRFQGSEGKLSKVSGIAGVDNPSYLAVDAARNILYAVSENGSGEGAVVSYHFDPESGELTELNRQLTQGDYPCFISVNEAGDYLLTVNYMSGSVCVYPIQGQGMIGSMTGQIQHIGRSIHSERQEAPHPHAIVQIPGTNFWIVPDLGNDTLYVYKLDTHNGKLHLQTKVQSEPGSGPRHVTFHPTEALVYIINELSSAVSVYRYNTKDGALFHMQSISTLADDFKGVSTCADIHISACGRFLYGSNRGHDSITVFRILDDGQLVSLGYAPTMGKTPRNFSLVDESDFMLVANQDSDNISIFQLSETGIPVSTNQMLEVMKPVCLKVIPI
ncbi:lactonase family protein [Paenibacillus aceris]|uniref:6-phosphogluconolactonase n=1 Tax=Paenibacillus aceris TaxID=869555 RepID=A0ABS4I326_9BACL|nr:lactonase family protein [Paenibacillus aceris]MBP1964946.1 6-phosphogluconolactonase [Paenibacillus aceris]NHW35607.1 lactonase family protein [Paenibacillus aceris]